MGWLDYFNKRKPHEIKGSTYGPLTNYQIRLVVNYGSGADSDDHCYLEGHCRTDFGDIRFTDTDQETELDYWMERYEVGDYAVFWIEIPNIPAYPSSVKIYLYYDKSDETTTSNGDNTFILFDDFGFLDQTKLQITEWATYPTYVVPTYLRVQSGQLMVYGDNANWRLARWIIDITPEDHVSFVYRARFPSYSYKRLMIFKQNNTYRWGLRDVSKDGNIDFQYRQNGGDLYVQDIFYFESNKWNIFEIKRLSSTLAEVVGHEDDWTELGSSSKSSDAWATSTFSPIISSYQGIWTYFDWIFVRNSVKPEPTHGDWAEDPLTGTIRRKTRMNIKKFQSSMPQRSLGGNVKSKKYTGVVVG